MANITAEMIARCTGPSLGLAEAMLKDIKPEQFARKPRFGDTTVNTNHPAFVYGHLATYPARIAAALGLDLPATQMPAHYADLFAAGKECQDDPEGKIYPPMQEITEKFFAAYRAVAAEVPNISDEALARPNPAEGRMKEMFPTIGALTNFLLTSHVMMHLGQVSAWRRCFGLGSAM